MIENIKKFLSGDYFACAAGAVAFVVWLFGWELAGWFVFAAVAAALLVCLKDVRPCIAVMCFVPLLTSATTVEQPSTVKIAVICVAVALFAAGFVVHFVRFRPKFKMNGLMLSFAFVLPLILLAGAFSPEYSFANLNNLANFAHYFWLAAACLLFACDEGDDFGQFACKLVMVLGFVILAQCVAYFVRAEDALAAMQKKQLHLGWAVGNSLAPVMNVAVACMLYLYVKKDNVLFMMCAALFAMVTVLTLSRGNIIALAAGLVALGVAVLVKCKNKKKTIVCIAAIVGVLLVAALLQLDLLKDVFAKMFEKGAYNEDRRLLWGDYVNRLRGDPVFGVGFVPEKFMPHSALLNVAACMGLAGLLAFAFHYFQKYKTLFCYRSTYQLFALIACLMVAGYAVIDLTAFNVAQQFAVFLLLEAAKREAAHTEKTKLAQKFDGFFVKYAPWLLAAGVLLWAGGTAWLFCSPRLEGAQWVLGEVDYAISLVLFAVATVLTFASLERLKKWGRQKNRLTT